ncbi:helix-turn-helix domain-containing protein [Leuconostoc carnosum]|uniref:XRE family transcriptional regulator n=1 Tax=Leuconostoc carnosum (strain JB16) TaxID=1229758 RepID=K0DEJ3_LEUCJ|nr:helix-turn-helix transcriptional regulator [Leuconostoc carnosum]AFT82441.1 XRE family transcriptional regulator [Leuconostoc carnosum JB16]KAA8327117.1 helix-turn-helix domain-containing protein [Leuconostoc carnosum]KAA8369479.1 helix-turn-helix domain-containing protein [Leuconostoc carnosum]KAA8380497.1 helix-turn-helix domain-containing protein [Leuconostoc carnosum]
MEDGRHNIIKEKRKLRNISQKQLGHIIGSQAMVSRIENGQTFPNSQSIYLICHTLDITIDEYFCSVFKTYENITIYRNELNEKYMNGDLKTLHKIYKRQQQRTSLDLKRKHFVLMARSTIYHLNFKLATLSDQNILFSYFNKVIHWQLYDICLLECTINMLPVNQVKPYFSDLLLQCVYNKNTVHYHDLIISIMIKYLETSIIQHQDTVTSFILLKIEDLEIHTNLDNKLWILFLTGIYHNNKQQMDQAYEIIKYINDPCTLHVFDRIRSYYFLK